MGGLGFLRWDAQYFLDALWVDGATLSAGIRPHQMADPSPGVYILPTYGPAPVVQRPFLGSKAPAIANQRAWSFDLTAANEADWKRLKRIRAGGAPVQLCTGMRVVDRWPSAIAGQSLTLTRTLAQGVVTEVNAVDHPTIVYLDGAVDAGAATVSGQTVTVVSSGDLAVEYTPLFYAMLTGMPEQHPFGAALTTTLTFEEVIQGTFDA